MYSTKQCCTCDVYSVVQYTSDTRYKARVLHTFARGRRQMHLYTEAYTCLYTVKWVFTRRQTRLQVKANTFALYLVPDVYCMWYMICDIVQLAEEHGVKFMETSAKSGLNVETVSSSLPHPFPSHFTHTPQDMRKHTPSFYPYTNCTLLSVTCSRVNEKTS